MPNFRLGELFCGPGGLGLAAVNTKIVDDNGEEYTISHEWANDYDYDTCETYRNNICPDNRNSVYYGDVRELNIKKLSKIDGFSFGFPCNTYSQVGEHKGLDDEKFGPLYTFGIKVLKTHKPQWFLAENVGGIQSANEGKALGIIEQAMIDAGYRIYPNLYQFEEYGVPQKRHRVIIVGIRKDLPYEFKIPSIDPYKDVDVSVETCLTVPPITSEMANTELTKQSRLVVERLQHIPEGHNCWNSDLPEHLQIHTRTKMSNIYRRLDRKQPSYTVTAAGGGGTHGYHWSEPRALTNRERARIQTFPDDFVFSGSKESVRKQIGMAVPPKGAKVIFEAILKTFAGIPYEWQEPNLAFEGDSEE